MASILVVDDEPSVVWLLQNALEEAGYTTLGAGDGVEALEVLQSSPVDLIVLDLLMPRMDGLEFLQRLRAPGDTRPVLVLTAVSDSIEAACERGATFALTKPFDPDRLLEVVAKLLHIEDSPG